MKQEAPDIWDAWRIGVRLRTGIDAAPKWGLGVAGKLAAHPAKALRYFSPIDYVRFREFDFALRAIRRFAPRAKRILDVSSPKLLPLTLAWHRPDAHIQATDILQHEVDWVGRQSARLQLNNISVHRCDARTLPLKDGSVDLYTSLSVFEHIAPEIDGELPAVREMARVLAPGGVAILTVPFSLKYFADYVAGTAYERSGSANEKIFFQRFYDEPMLRRNLIDASGLNEVYTRYIEERVFKDNPRRRLAHYINASPLQNKVFGVAYPLLSTFFLSSPKGLGKCRKPYIACLVLRRAL